MLRLLRTAICLCLLLIPGTVPSFAQSRSVNETPMVTAYRLPKTLDGKIAEDILRSMLSGREGVRLAFDQSTGNLVASARPNDHVEIANTLEILQKPVRINAESISGQPTRSGNYLCVYALDGSIKNTAHGVVESLLAGKDGVRLALDPKASNLNVMAAAPEHQLIASVLSELSQKSHDPAKIITSTDDQNFFSIHTLRDNLILLNSQSGDTWILSEAKEAESRAWTRINRNK